MRLFWSAAGLALSSSACLAIDPSFTPLEGPVSVAGVSGTVLASIRADIDGPGPRPESLIVAGNFQQAGGITCNNVALWNGTAWEPLGQGLTGPAPITEFGPSVVALAMYNGQLVAAGTFSSADGTPTRNVATFDGTRWQPLGLNTDWDDAELRDLAVYNGDLYATGYYNFRIPPRDGEPAGYRIVLARWNGTQWQNILPQPRTVGLGQSLAVYNNELIWGGTLTFMNNDGVAYNNFLAYNGSTFRALGGGVGRTEPCDGIDVSVAGGCTTVFDMVVHQGGLWAAGEFELAAGQPASGLARWNGSAWQTFTDGNDGRSYLNINRLHSDGTTLYAGGAFLSLGGVDATRLAKFNGTTWSEIGSAFDPNAAGGVYAISGNATSLDIGGEFPSVGGTSVLNAARFNGSSWSALGSDVGFDASPSSFVEYNGNLVALGRFTRTDSGPAQFAAVRVGSTWQPLSQTPPEPLGAATVIGDSIYAVGAPGDFPVLLNVYRWNGSAWSVFATVEPLDGFGCDVSTIFSTPEGVAIAGQFERVNGVQAPGAAVRAAAGWRPLGAGFDAETRVSGLVHFNGSLHAVGDFGTSPTNDFFRLARLDPSGWTKLATPFGGFPNAGGVVYKGELHVGGNIGFEDPSTGAFNGGVLRWDGTTWRFTDTGLQQFTNVFALGVAGGELIAGGEFQRIGSINGTGPIARGIARWNGRTWSSFGSASPEASFSPGIYSLFASGDDFYASGAFQRVGGRLVSGLGNWTMPCRADVDDGTGTGTPDAGVGIEDLLYYLALFEAGVVGADLDDGSATGLPDGGVGIEDLLYYLARFASGC